jgi:plastocyanin
MDANLKVSRPRTPAIAWIAALVLSAALAGSSIASGAPAAKVVNGTVGPGFTITLTLGGKKVTKLKAGTRYRFVISDRATIHDFHLAGPGLNRVLTTVDFTGTRSVLLTLKKGSYRYFCDPHASFMKGAFRAT